MDVTRRYAHGDNVFHCPIVREQNAKDYGYAMVATMSNARVGDVPNPDEAPLLFESALLYRNAHSGFKGFPSPLRHGNGFSVAFADGHVRSMTPAQAAELAKSTETKKP